MEYNPPHTQKKEKKNVTTKMSTSAATAKNPTSAPTTLPPVSFLLYRRATAYLLRCIAFSLLARGLRSCDGEPLAPGFCFCDGGREEEARMDDKGGNLDGVLKEVVDLVSAPSIPLPRRPRRPRLDSVRVSGGRIRAARRRSARVLFLKA
jgi:hypothetical protein